LAGKNEISVMILICIFFMTKDVEYVLMYLYNNDYSESCFFFFYLKGFSYVYLYLVILKL
jgi:hypothetical protein